MTGISLEAKARIVSQLKTMFNILLKTDVAATTKADATQTVLFSGTRSRD